MKRAERGVTFVELVMTIVVLGIAATGVLMVFTNTVARSADPMIHHQAIAIAEAYLEEVLLRPFDDPDAMPAGSRANYDHIFDYHGLTGPPADQFGVPLGLPAYTVSVAVTAAPPEGLGGIAPAGSVARVDVTVAHTGGITVLLSGYRTRY
ncbi:MAG: prepilin-type N-terminal cleavage/methylation domain-containing protein [Xanthomonadaceae bacterium]|nr:prepilin-type N-terminal cleavage/methylation domain-containing protein [Xanthomonadaceae bacterium]